MGLLGGVTERLEFLLDLNAAKAEGAAHHAADTFEHELGRADKSVDNTGRKLQGFGVGAVAFAGVALKGLGDFAHAAEESEQVTIKLETAVENNASTAGDSIKPYQDLATAIEHKTAADDEDVALGESVLAQLGLTKDRITELTPLMVDYARNKGIDMATAAKNVANAVNGKATALQKTLGPIDAAAYASDHYSAVVDKLRGTVGGFAEREGQTFSGRMERLGNIAHDLEEKIGVGVVHAFEHLADAGENVISVVDQLSPGVAAGIGEWGTYAAAAIGAAGALSFTIGTVERGIDRFGTLAEWLHVKQAATIADTATTEMNTAATVAATVATEEYALVNMDWAATEAEVAIAAEARLLATQEIALADGEAALAAAGLIVAEEGVAVASSEAAVAEGAATVAGIGMAGMLGIAVGAAALGVVAFAGLGDTLSTNTKGTDDYTKALQTNTGAIEDNVAAVTARKLAESDAAKVANDAGISYEEQARAIRHGTDNWGEYSRQLDQARESGVDQATTLQELERGLRGAGAGNTEFGQSLLQQLDAGHLSIDQAKQLILEMQGLHNGYTEASRAVGDKAGKEADASKIAAELGTTTDDTTKSVQEEAAALDKLTRRLDEARGAQESLIGSEVSLAKAHQSTQDSIEKLAGAQDKANTSTGADGVKAQRDLEAALTDTIGSIDSEAQSAARAAETQAKANGHQWTAVEASNAYMAKLLELAGTLDPNSELGKRMAMYIAQLQQTQGTFKSTIDADLSPAAAAFDAFMQKYGDKAQLVTWSGGPKHYSAIGTSELAEGVTEVGEQGREQIVRHGSHVEVVSSGAARGQGGGAGVNIGQLTIVGASAAEVVDEIAWQVRMARF